MTTLGVVPLVPQKVGPPLFKRLRRRRGGQTDVWHQCGVKLAVIFSDPFHRPDVLDTVLLDALLHRQPRHTDIDRR